MWYEIEIFVKAECLVKAVKKYFLKKLSVWLALIKVIVWEVNYQKRQCLSKENSLFTSLNASYGHNIYTKISQ